MFAPVAVPSSVELDSAPVRWGFPWASEGMMMRVTNQGLTVGLLDSGKLVVLKDEEVRAACESGKLLASGVFWPDETLVSIRERLGELAKQYYGDSTGKSWLA